MEILLRVLMLLSGIKTYSVLELAELFEKSERSVYRYLDAIERAGFVLERNDAAGSTRYKLASKDVETKSIRDLLHFSEEEANLIYRMLTDMDATSPIKEQLIKKMHTLYDIKAIQTGKIDKLKKIKALSEAINSKNIVILHQYRSSHSGGTTDREVEAFQFMEDYKGIWCFDLKDKQIKQFRISRIEEVEVLSHRWSYEELHQIPFTDAFRMSATKPLVTVEASLSLKAYNLLIEEFPLAKKHINKINENYNLEIPVADYQGIGRFVLGLPGEILIIKPKEFKQFLKNKLALTVFDSV